MVAALRPIQISPRAPLSAVEALQTASSQLCRDCGQESVRPKAMTVAAAFTGLLPIMWSTETGSDLMKRIAAPMVGGLVTSFLLELLVYPAIYYLWRRREVTDGPAAPEWTDVAESKGPC
jgi:Cu/Ag efflux pump CusA